METSFAAHFRRLFDYERDAHQKILASLAAVPAKARDTTFQEALDLFGHVLAARLLWLARFGVGQQPETAFPKNTSLEELSQLAASMHSTWSHYLAGLNDAGLQDVFEYKSLEGESCKSIWSDVLTQLYGHSLYHAGQIASRVRALGSDPAVTDFIYWSRKVTV